MTLYYLSSLSSYLFSSIIPGAARNFYGETSDLKKNYNKYVFITQEQLQKTINSLKPVEKSDDIPDETFEDCMGTHIKWTKNGIKRKLSLYEIVSKDIKKSEDCDNCSNKLTKILRSYNVQVIRKKKLNKAINLLNI